MFFRAAANPLTGLVKKKSAGLRGPKQIAIKSYLPLPLRLLSSASCLLTAVVSFPI
jgi:hypothetical protein